jgi:hypothetical protein
MPTPEQQQALLDAESVIQAAGSVGGKKILAHLQALADEAKEECFACQGGDVVRAGFHRRWQQREAVIREVNAWIQGLQGQVEQIKQEIQQEEQWEQRQHQPVQW